MKKINFLMIVVLLLLSVLWGSSEAKTRRQLAEEMKKKGEALSAACKTGIAAKCIKARNEYFEAIREYNKTLPPAQRISIEPKSKGRK